MSKAILATTVTATAALAASHFVGFDGAPTGVDGLIYGVSKIPADQAGDDISIDVLGETEVVSGGAFNAGDLLSSDANSQAVTGGTKPGARALEAASAAGEKVRILLLPNNT